MKNDVDKFPRTCYIVISIGKKHFTEKLRPHGSNSIEFLKMRLELTKEAAQVEKKVVEEYY